MNFCYIFYEANYKKLRQLIGSQPIKTMPKLPSP